MASEQDVLDALRGIKDPDSQKDIVALGLVRDLAVEGGEVSFTLAFAAQPPQTKVMIHSMASRLVGRLPGVSRVSAKMGGGAATVQYPHEKEAPPLRARGVIALREVNCTVCMLCARSCPDWCIYIEGHKEKRPPRREGGRERTVSVLDRFDIDYALCMYCGICVEVCPFDALFWSPEYEYSEPRIAELLHDKDKLGEWMETVPEPEPLELGAEKAKK